jgi:flagellar motility protein MotE (MotC chaperone)
LPAIVFAAFMMTGLRVNAVFEMMEKGDVFRAATPSPMIDASGDAPQLAQAEPVASKPLTNTAHAASNDEKAASPTPKADDDDDAQPRSAAENDIMNQLAKRRQEIEDRAKALDTREALIGVAEQRVDQKLKEMEALRNQVQTLLNQAGAAQQTQIENLVKIYETMKPKEAAKIFDALDMPILLGVVQKMKPQRVSAIMAEMAPEKAKEITVALTRQDQLPQLK